MDEIAAATARALDRLRARHPLEFAELLHAELGRPDESPPAAPRATRLGFSRPMPAPQLPEGAAVVVDPDGKAWVGPADILESMANPRKLWDTTPAAAPFPSPPFTDMEWRHKSDQVRRGQVLAAIELQRDAQMMRDTMTALRITPLDEHGSPQHDQATVHRATVEHRGDHETRPARPVEMWDPLTAATNCDRFRGMIGHLRHGRCPGYSDPRMLPHNGHPADCSCHDCPSRTAPRLLYTGLDGSGKRHACRHQNGTSYALCNALVTAGPHGLAARIDCHICRGRMPDG